jgi:hypothetical protein
MLSYFGRRETEHISNVDLSLNRRERRESKPTYSFVSFLLSGPDRSDMARVRYVFERRQQSMKVRMFDFGRI